MLSCIKKIITNIRQYASRPLIWYRETSKGGIMMRDISAFFYCVQKKYTSNSLIVSHMETDVEEKKLCPPLVLKNLILMGNIHDMQVSCIFPFVMFMGNMRVSSSFNKIVDKEDEDEDLN